MPQFGVQCGGCGAILEETSLQQDDWVHCAACGSRIRHINVSITDEIQIKEQIGMKVKDPNRTGKKKIKIEQLVGDDLHRQSGKWYNKVRVIDRENNRYVEEVTDPDTGSVIHRCEEPLSEHFGHGSARATGEDAEQTDPPKPDLHGFPD
jgi:hypothetical protein